MCLVVKTMMMRMLVMMIYDGGIDDADGGKEHEEDVIATE